MMSHHIFQSNSGELHQHGEHDRPDEGADRSPGRSPRPPSRRHQRKDRVQVGRLR